ncbi:MAG: hypothetical protein K2G52_12805 [Muribaculaceae bacterium]|nr:hypothetical protein [Muribaculaceae bacterium]
MIACILIGILMSGCSPKTQPVVVRETRTVLETDSLTRLINRLVAYGFRETDRETVYMIDKTTYTVNEKGDTIGNNARHRPPQIRQTDNGARKEISRASTRTHGMKEKSFGR